nr:ribonuclease H-like domain-containing protein [Tanacetum cinerariifolium]
MSLFKYGGAPPAYETRIEIPLLEVPIPSYESSTSQIASSSANTSLTGSSSANTSQMTNLNIGSTSDTDDELTEKELKQIEADDQAIQTILLGLPEDIYVVVDSCETAQEIWLRVQQMMKGSNIGIQEKKAKLFNEWERFTSNEEESTESYFLEVDE